jgi:hypothetical protein
MNSRTALILRSAAFSTNWRKASIARITAAYFVADDDLVARLCDAADRDVSIQILLPGANADKRFVQLAGEADRAGAAATVRFSFHA